MSDSTPTPPLLPDPSHEAGSAATRTILLGMARPSLRADCEAVPSGPREGDGVLQPDASGCMMPRVYVQGKWRDAVIPAPAKAQGPERPVVEGDALREGGDLEDVWTGPTGTVRLGPQASGPERGSVLAAWGVDYAAIGRRLLGHVADATGMPIKAIAAQTGKQRERSYDLHDSTTFMLSEEQRASLTGRSETSLGYTEGPNAHRLPSGMFAQHRLRGDYAVMDSRRPTFAESMLSASRAWTAPHAASFDFKSEAPEYVEPERDIKVFGEPRQRPPRTPITLTEQWQVEALIGCKVKPVGSLYPAGVLTRVNDRTMIIGDMAYAWRCHKVELLALPERGTTVEVSSVGGIRVKVESDDRMDALRSAWQRFDAWSSEVLGTRDEYNRIAERAAEDVIEQLVVRPCPRCNDTGILRGFGFGTSVDACDRPCGCKPVKVEGPSEWTITKREHLIEGCVWDIEARKGDEVFVGFVSAYACGTQVSREPWGRGGDLVVRVRGEKAPDMAIARLLCGLRDGTVKP